MSDHTPVYIPCMKRFDDLVTPREAWVIRKYDATPYHTKSHLTADYRWSNEPEEFGFITDKAELPTVCEKAVKLAPNGERVTIMRVLLRLDAKDLAEEVLPASDLN